MKEPIRILKAVLDAQTWDSPKPETRIKEIEEIKKTLVLLESYPKWEPLIEAAGKVDKGEALKWLNEATKIYHQDREWTNTAHSSMESIAMLLESIPNVEK